MNQPPQPPSDQPPQQPGYQPSQPPQQPGSYPPPQQQQPGNYPPPGSYPPPPGNFPPPPGNYPPPPPGYYPPPPGYNQPPGAPPGYGPPAGSQFSVGDGFSWAWKQFSKNAVPLLLATLIFGVILSVLSGIHYAVLSATSPDQVTDYYSGSSGFSYSTSLALGPTGTIVAILGGLVLIAIAGAMGSAYIGGLLDIADGRPVTVGSFFKPRHIGSVVIVTLIIGVLSSIGNFLCFIPGLVVSIFTMFAIVAVIDRGLSPIDALKASFEIVKANFVQALLVWLVAIAITVVGALLCGVGLIVAVPVAFLFEVYAYRRLSGGQVASAV